MEARKQWDGIFKALKGKKQNKQRKKKPTNQELYICKKIFLKNEEIKALPYKQKLWK